MIRAACNYSLVALLPLILSGCIVVPEDTENQREVAILQRGGWAPDLGPLGGDDLENRVRMEIETPIEFHGLVHDENGQPVPEMPVKILVFDRVLEPFHSPYFGWTHVRGVSTDKQGRFSVTGRRGAALVASVSAREYWDVDEKRAHRVYYYSPYRLSDNTHSLPVDKDQPALFRLDRKPENVRADLVRLGSVILPVGREVGLALDQPRHTVLPERADILVRLDMDHTVDGEPYDWSLRIRVPGGGIQRVRTLFLDQAPATGYASELLVSASASAVGWDHRDEAFCFIRTADGNYGAVTLRVRTRSQPFISIAGKLNPHGLRYLD